ncbi:hypothetical protein [Roseomonas marmotae]|uniref:Uncharacterized protein n=1 Tax=Roseomonas marmotae TaxID=2768161 RepID=A0ABS3K8H4_9PROT|nr:hypothetical protein [Roseomonas marmotae]MBO1073765.1 hypothetical protein [Roseomonas marmotae]QTI78603.1 hypothetical protein IAI58_13115 [Roseomonas marmotae]
MPQHSFNIGQRLEFVSDRMSPSAPRGTYTITRLLPNDGMDREYRIKHDHDGHERVVRESQLRLPPGL